MSRIESSNHLFSSLGNQPPYLCGDQKSPHPYNKRHLCCSHHLGNSKVLVTLCQKREQIPNPYFLFKTLSYPALEITPQATGYALCSPPPERTECFLLGPAFCCLLTDYKARASHKSKDPVCWGPILPPSDFGNVALFLPAFPVKHTGLSFQYRGPGCGFKQPFSVLQNLQGKEIKREVKL